MHTVIETENFKWIDIVNATNEELSKLAAENNIHAETVLDCMDPEHLPKFEQIEGFNFLLLRAFDDTSSHDADTIQELTRKLAILYSSKLLVTIHRKEQPYLKKVIEKWKSKDSKKISIPGILNDLIIGVFESYEKPIDLALGQLEKLEMGLFGAQGGKNFELKEGYFLKRKASVIKRVVRLSMDSLPKLWATDTNIFSKPIIQNLKDLADSYYFFADDLNENISNLMSLHLSISSYRQNEASHRINEVMRVLTVFSVFLLPLNVITGIYGMNFVHMPELQHPYAYPLVLSLMGLVVIGTYLWFRRKGWLK